MGSLLSGGAVAGTWISLFDPAPVFAVLVTAGLVLAVNFAVELRRHWGVIDPSLVAVGTLLAVVSLSLAGAVGYELAPPTSRQAVDGGTEAATTPPPTPRAPANSATPSVSRTPSPSPTQPNVKPAFVIDLAYEEGNSKPGLATIGTKRFAKSLRTSLCFNYPITVPVAAEYRKFTTTVGFASDSHSKSADITLQVESTVDPPASEDALWQRLEVVTLLTRGAGQPLSVSLPAGTTALRLSATHYACSTEVVWGDPQLS